MSDTAKRARPAIGTAARAAVFGLGVIATGGLLLSASDPAPTPGTAVGPAAERPPGGNGRTGSLVTSRHIILRVLSAADADRYRQIFRLQKAGEFRKADRDIAALNDDSLLGHVLAARYLDDDGYRASYDELVAWLDRYADHPEAPAIHRLAQRRHPKGRSAPPAPQSVQIGPFRADTEERRAMTALPDPAKVIPQQRLSQRGRIQSPQAGPRDRTRQAFTLASATPGHHVTGRWPAGLRAWVKGRYGEAARNFAAVANAPHGDDRIRAAGAYWAARAYLADRHPEKVDAFLSLAAEYPRSFYGLLATRTLGREPSFNWSVPAFDRTTADLLESLPAGHRALALLQVGRTGDAEAELTAMAKDANRSLMRAIFAVASRSNMPEFLFRLGNRIRDRGGRPYDSALYPLPRWRPAGGYTVDRAVIFGIMRQESKFRPEALSPAGARGLMQIMPPTASRIADDRTLDGGGVSRLFDPEFNVALAQKYIGRLLANSLVKSDLFLLATAYNGGLGNLQRWRNHKSDDPLLFIESIPVSETRRYVEQVLTNVWMYRLRLGQDTPSLDALAAGDWPVYIALDADPGTRIAGLPTTSRGNDSDAGG